MKTFLVITFLLFTSCFSFASKTNYLKCEVRRYHVEAIEYYLEVTREITGTDPLYSVHKEHFKLFQNNNVLIDEEVKDFSTYNSVASYVGEGFIFMLDFRSLFGELKLSGPKYGREFFRVSCSK